MHNKSIDYPQVVNSRILLPSYFRAYYMYIIAGSIIVTSILPIAIPTNYRQKPPSTTTTTTTQEDPSCNNLYSGPNLWSHVCAVAGRLTAKRPDGTTVTGTVLLSISKAIITAAVPVRSYVLDV